MRTVDHKGLIENMSSILESFTPNAELSPRYNESSFRERVDYVDIREQEPGTLIFLRGIHSGEDYRIRVNENDLEIWRNADANGFRGSFDSIVSWQNTHEGFAIEEGVIRMNSYSMMPYFRYDNSNPKIESVKKPTDNWLNAYRLIFVQVPK